MLAYFYIKMNRTQYSSTNIMTWNLEGETLVITCFEASIMISPGDIYKSLLQELINTVIPGGCPVDERNNKLIPMDH